MSNRYITEAWKVRGLTAAEKCVYVRMADFADARGECWPSHERLAEDCGLSERHIRTVIESLRKKRLVTPKLTARRTSGRSRYTYKLTPEQASPVTPEQASADTGNLSRRHRNRLPVPISTSTDPLLTGEAKW